MTMISEKPATEVGRRNILAVAGTVAATILLVLAAPAGAQTADRLYLLDCGPPERPARDALFVLNARQWQAVTKWMTDPEAPESLPEPITE